MLGQEVSQQTAGGNGAIENVLAQPIVAGQTKVFFRQLLCPPALRVLTGGEQLFLAALENPADILKKGDTGDRLTPLPISHSGICDKDPLGELLLGHAQLFAPLENESTQ